MIRFIHSSDLHLGKRFGNFDGDLPSRLREARHGVLGRLAEHARGNGASVIVLAGDTFDTETPAADVRRQAMTAMAQQPDVRWIILPGNHDSLQASALWENLVRECPANVTLATEAAPIDLGSGATILPAPCTTRRPGRDLSAWMDAAVTAEGAIRIGLAHGPIQSFSEDSGTTGIIAPDRARRAGLDYLALGDWHGLVEVDPRTRYSGTPEQDRFKHAQPGAALLVEIGGQGAVPQVTRVATAQFTWSNLELHLLADEDPAAALDQLLPEIGARRQTLLQISASGNTRLSGHTALAEHVANVAPDFAYLKLDDRDLRIECAVDDLDQIDRAGALREAADALLAQSEDASQSAQDRAIAAAALSRLYAFAQGAAA